MVFDVYRPAGTTTWVDRKGEECHGYERLDKVGQVEARTAAEAMDKARTILNPSPILQLVRSAHRGGFQRVVH